MVELHVTSAPPSTETLQTAGTMLSLILGFSRLRHLWWEMDVAPKNGNPMEEGDQRYQFNFTLHFKPAS